MARKWEAAFLLVVYKELPLFRCVPHWIILRTYVDEYESHLRMVHSTCDNPPRKIPYYRLNQSTLVIKQ
jgi:hypothetical protein